MIELEIHAAKTFFSGPDKELDVMYECLRLQDKNAYWKAKFVLQRMGYYKGKELTDSEDEKRNEVIEASKYTKFYDKRDHSFFTGLLRRVKDYLNERGIPYVTENHRKKRIRFEKKIKFRFVDEIEARDEQLAVLKVALKKGCGIIHCAPNFGKTEVSCAIIAQCKYEIGKTPRALFLIHRKGLAEQTQRRYIKHLGTSKIALLSGGHRTIRKITVATTQTAARLIDAKSQEFKDYLKECDIVFLDEFHVNKSTQVQKIMKHCGARMRFGLSGTIKKGDSVKMMTFEGLTGPVIAEVLNEELVRLGRSARPLIKMYEIDTEMVYGHFAEAYREAVVWNRYRNSQVVERALKHVDKNRRTLITVGRIRHGKILKELLERDTDIPIEFIHGGTPSHIRWEIKKKFARGKIPVLIASPIFDVGEDIPEIDAWVNAAGGKGWELVIQRLGRTMRKKKGENVVHVTDFIDKHNKYMMKHSLHRLRYYVEQNIGEVRLME